MLVLVALFTIALAYIFPLLIFTSSLQDTKLHLCSDSDTPPSRRATAAPSGSIIRRPSDDTRTNITVQYS